MGACRNPLGADKKSWSIRVEPGHHGQGAGHGVEPVVIGFVVRMVRECTGWFNCESGFWAIIERKIQYG
jgi:hypothetical protein